jgi:hypothetical protein
VRDFSSQCSDSRAVLLGAVASLLSDRREDILLCQRLQERG